MTKPPRKQPPFWVSVVANLLASLILVTAVQGFVIKIYRVPSGSMERTLQGSQGSGDRILVNRLAYLDEGPRPQDIVVFTRPESWQSETATPGSSLLSTLLRGFGDITGIGPSHEQYMVKRVIAVGGQRVNCCGVDGKIIVDGFPIEEPYIYQDFDFQNGKVDCSPETPSPRCFPVFTVPPGQLVVLGDHRSDSSDSVTLCRMQSPGAAAGCMRTISQTDVIGKVSSIVWPLARIGIVN